MSHLRTATIPIDHVLAEMAAFPLASPTSMSLGLAALDPRLSLDSAAGSAQHQTARLWRAAEASLVRGCPAVSVDELVAVRDDVWFSAARNSAPLPLHRFLHHVAARHLKPHGASASPCVSNATLQRDDRDEAVLNSRAREVWRWLTFALPPDLLLAALGNGRSMPVTVESISPQIALDLKTHGFAESHLHLGAAFEFGLYWVATLCSLADRQLTSSGFQSPGAELEEGRELASWLLHGAIVRYVLAGFLFHHSDASAKRRNLSEYLRHHVFSPVQRRLGSTAAVLLYGVINDLGAGQPVTDAERFALLQDLYRQLTGATPNSFPHCKTARPGDVCAPHLRQAMLADPIAGMWSSSGDQGPSPEMLFISAGLGYLKQREIRDSDAVFAKLFWQVVRTRNVLYRHIVQRPLTPGLQWFVRTFGRLAPGKSPLDICMFVESAAQVCGIGRGLRALEVRTSPGGDRKSLLQMIRMADSHFQDVVASPKTQQERSGRGTVGDPPCEFGIVFHLTKDRGGGAREGAPAADWYRSHADPDPRHGSNVLGYRYSRYYQQARRQASSLARVLLDFPLSLAVVRGIDICTDELGTPTWVFVPLFRYLHEVSRSVSAWLQTQAGLQIPPLRTTVHVGEDYVHLLGGLRRIDEAIRCLGMREGDRLGHAVALGIDARRWCLGAGRVPMMREERLLDLTWEWSFISVNGIPASAQRQAYLEREIARLSMTLFADDPMTPYDCDVFVRYLHREDALARLGFPGGWQHANPPSRDGVLGTAWPARTMHRLKQYLSCPRLFRRGRVIEWIDPRSEVDTLEALQEQLRRRASEMGLTVEANPSSNLLIGNLGDLKSGHPFWRFDPPTPTNETHRVPLCIGSDDPITFGTQLRGEYMLIHDALVLGGTSYADADEWLARVRENGLRSRFTIPRPNSDDICHWHGTVDESRLQPIL